MNGTSIMNKNRRTIRQINRFRNNFVIRSKPMCRGSKICSLAPESKSHISDLEEIEQEKMDDIPETEEELIRLALGEGVDDEGSKFTC